MKLTSCAGLFLLLGSTLTAQNPRPSSEIDQRAERMRQSVTTGKQVRAHARVELKLNNGNKLNGVVRDSQLIERIDGLDFVPATVNDKDAGIRLWYSDGTISYIFLRFKEIKEYRLNAKLSAEQVKAIEDDLRTKQTATDRAKAEQEAAAKAAAAADKATEVKPGDTAEKPAAGTGPSEEDKRLLELLKAYPPKDGWNADRRDEIKRRIAVLGANPSQKEKDFVASFGDWEKARAKFPQAEEEPSADVPPMPKPRR